MLIFDFLQTNPAAFFSTIFILGLLIGSFLNVVIHRYPIMLQKQWRSECCEYLSEQETIKQSIPDREQYIQDQQTYSLSKPRSHCPKCQHQIKFYENIPIISWLLLKGKCSNCNSAISLRYPLVELLTAVLSLMIATKFGFTIATMGYLILTWSLICLSLIDYDSKLLPDDISLPLMWLGLLFSLLGFSPISPQDALIGAMVGYLSLWSVYQLLKLITGKEGMGYGDFKLLAVFGAWLGWQQLAAIIFLSTLSGAIIGISLQLAFKKDKNVPIPFGPYISIAGFIALFWGNDITQAYLSYSGLV